MLRSALLLCLALPLFAADESITEAEARLTMAQLLKVKPEPPAVAVTLANRTQEDGLIVEDIWWPAFDGERVPAYVIRPAKANGRLPGLVCLHSTGGSRESDTTAKFGLGEWTRPGGQGTQKRMLGWARELARRGYVILTLNQRGLDNRLPDTNTRAKDMLVRGRTLMGTIVDEIRQGVTHLRSLDSVRPDAIGVTGMSFGGITAFYTWIVDDRINAAAPVCGGIGSVDSLLREGKPDYHGFYWWVPGIIAHGDQGRFAAALAPRPLFVWAPTEDIGMPRAGVDAFAAEVRRAYGPDSPFELHQPPGEHAFTHEAFDAMLAFFDKHLSPKSRTIH
jgi:dienelactone hydrolase